MAVAKLAVRAVLVSALSVTLVPVLGANPAFACSCAQAPDNEHFERADVVFKGTIRTTTPPTAEQQQRGGSAAPVTYEFLPTRAYKGTVTSPVLVSSASSGASCGVEMSGEGPFLVFARKVEKNTVRTSDAGLQASLCGGTHELGPKEKVPFGPGRAVTAPAEASPSPKPTATMTPARSQSAVPAGMALPLVGGLVAVMLGAAAWATRTSPSIGSRKN